MKKFLFIVSILLMWVTNSYSKELKIGYVDFFKVYNEYEKTKEYEKIIDEKKENKEQELKTKAKELEKLQNKISMLNEKEQEKEKEDFRKKLTDFEKMRRSSYIDLKKERDEMMKEIITDIESVIRNYAKKNNFDFVLNENIVLFGDPSVDITKDILKIVNEEYRKKKQ
ncbi:MAG: OmpH family outer membrane protein [Candidatus Omnitrophica bacterium]|nr:OmpH family outer membrane protein [Candidatus Omnitrophota bacterium]